MTNYRFDVNCPDCDGELQHQWNAEHHTGMGSKATAACVDCGSEYLISVVLTPITHPAS
jgi:primosomal protein N'